MNLYADIRGVPRKGASNDSRVVHRVVDDANFQLFNGYLFRNFKQDIYRICLYIQDMIQPLVGFSVILKCMILNGPE